MFSAALVGGVLGTFLGGFSKFLWERWLPDWLTWRRSQRVERAHQLSTLRAPAYEALGDLRGRLRAIAHTDGANARFTVAIGEVNYYPYSTAFLVARALAAQEVLRRRMATPDYAALYQGLERLTSALSHGERGFQFFRLEQREIGERMLGADTDVPTYRQLSEFLDRLEQEDPPRWMRTTCNRVKTLLKDPMREADRLQAIDEALTSMMGSSTQMATGSR